MLWYCQFMFVDDVFMLPSHSSVLSSRNEYQYQYLYQLYINFVSLLCNELGKLFCLFYLFVTHLTSIHINKSIIEYHHQRNSWTKNVLGVKFYRHLQRLLYRNTLLTTSEYQPLERSRRRRLQKPYRLPLLFRAVKKPNEVALQKKFKDLFDHVDLVTNHFHITLKRMQAFVEALHDDVQLWRLTWVDVLSTSGETQSVSSSDGCHRTRQCSWST